MTQPDLSSLALPDSPELPSEIEAELRAIEHSTPLEAVRMLHGLRSVIAKHLLTAQEARAIADDWDNLGWSHLMSREQKATMHSAIEKVRRLSGSSRGEP